MLIDTIYRVCVCVCVYIEKQLATTKRVDAIWDRYLPDSLKATARERREHESDSGCDTMGMGKFREIGTYLQKESNKKLRWNCSITCQ